MNKVTGQEIAIPNVDGKSVFEFHSFWNDGGVCASHCRTIYVVSDDLNKATTDVQKCLFSDEWIEEAGKPASITVHIFA